MKHRQTVQLILLTVCISCLTTTCRSSKTAECQWVLNEIEQNSDRLQARSVLARERLQIALHALVAYCKN